MGFLDFLFGPKRGSVHDLEAKNGFRDLKFGQDVSSVDGLEFCGEFGAPEKALYKRPSDSLRIGEADLTSINYCFTNGKLSMVLMDLDNYDEFNRLCEVFLAAYGVPRYVQGIDEYHWDGPTIGLDVSWMPEFSHGTAIMIKFTAPAQSLEDRAADAARGVADL